jgi:hypothetical protein
MTLLQFALSESKLLSQVHRIPFKVVQKPNRSVLLQLMFSEQKLLPKVAKFLPPQIAMMKLHLQNTQNLWRVE